MLESSLFSKTYPVPVQECDENGLCRLPYLLRCMEDSSFADSERIGQGKALLREKYGLSWMLFQSELNVAALPKAGNMICVQTSYCGVRGAVASRIYDILQNGNPIIHCVQTWVVVRIATRRLANPQKVPELMQPGFPAPLRFCRFVRAELPLQHIAEGCVEASDLDFNGHMNNVRYVEHALPYLPEGSLHSALRMQLAYQYELLQGQCYDCLVANADGTKQVVFRAGGKDCFVMQVSAT